MLERKILSNLIVEAVNQMPAAVRRVFILSHYHGLSVKEIAEDLGIMEGEAESLLIAGNTVLHQILPNEVEFSSASE